MEKFIKHFVRRIDGTWQCVSFAEVNGPNGHVQVTPGWCFTRSTNFMGVNLAEWLDREYEKQHPRSSP